VSSPKFALTGELRSVQKTDAPVQDRGAKGPSASISFHDRPERACSRIACMRRRSSSRRRRRHRICHRRKPQPPHRASTGSHGRSHSLCNYCGCSCWRRRLRRDPRCRENWPGRGRDHAIRQHHRDEADHRRCRAEVRPRGHGAEGQRRQVRQEDRREEDHRRRDPEEDRWRRDPGEDQREQGGPGGGPNCASAVLGAATAAPSNTLAHSVSRVFIDIVYLLRSRVLAERWPWLAHPRLTGRAPEISSLADDRFSGGGRRPRG
jgi:hypothetical protein